jgi:LDH2 family malate/lactate/ureidoglycolate dehydrogenase
MFQQLGKQIPLGWGLDSEGRLTTEPADVRQVLPLGGTRELGSHKGYGLAMIVQVLCAVLSGAWFNQTEGGTTNETGYTQKQGAHFFGAMRVDAFCDVDAFKRGMDAMIRVIHASEPAAGHDHIYVPGEIEYETAQQRLRDGIPLPAYVVDELRVLATEYGVPFP